MRRKRKPTAEIVKAQKFIAFAQVRKASETRIRNQVSRESRREFLVKNQTARPWSSDVRHARGKIGKRVAVAANCARRRSSDFGEQAIAPRARCPSNEAQNFYAGLSNRPVTWATNDRDARKTRSSETISQREASDVDLT